LIVEEVFKKTNLNLQNALFHAGLKQFHAFCTKPAGQHGKAKANAGTFKQSFWADANLAACNN